MSDATSHGIRLIYLHGFNSSPESQKAKSLLAFAGGALTDSVQGRTLDVQVPAIPHKPAFATDLLEQLIQEFDGEVVLVGSSLGGFYSIYLAEKHGCKAVLVNPLARLHEDMADDFLGRHVNPYTGEEFEIDMQDAEYLLELEVDRISNQENYFLLLEQGDEVLDYQVALEKFPLARKVVLPGGTHRFKNFEKYLPAIIEFAGMEP